MPVEQSQVETRSLGDCVLVFRPAVGNIVAGYILAGLFLMAGAASVCFSVRKASEAAWNLPLWDNEPRTWCWTLFGFFCLLGVVLGGLGAWLAVFATRLISCRVEWCRDGFRYVSRRTDDEVRWNEIRAVQERIVYERPPVVKGPAQLLLPKIASVSYMVTAATGKDYDFDGNSVKAIKRLGNLLREEAKRHALPWTTVEEHA